MKNENIFFATCSKGLEDLLLKELQQMGIDSATQEYSGVAFTGSLEQAYRACLWSRLASRVFLKLKSFDADSDGALYEGIQTINWPEHLDKDGTLAVTCTLNRSTITNSHYASLKTKDAVVDQFNDLYETRPSVDRDTPDVRINVHIDHDVVDVSIDLSGGPLHKRGYRLTSGAAPLKENLAAAILMRAGWASGKEDQALNLLDPMCGSATFLIEAAMMSLNIAPGLRRSYYGFLAWKGHDEPIWKALQLEAKQAVKAIADISNTFTGYDVDKYVIASARQNVHSAGLQDLIRLAHQDFNDTIEVIKSNTDEQSARESMGQSTGQNMLIVNPPYGERLGERQELAHLYAEMGEAWREHFPNWKIALFTANDELIKHIGLRAHRTNSFFNGAIKCKLLQYQIRPALSAEQKKIKDDRNTEQRAAITNRLKKNVKHIGRWAKRNGVEAYRLYSADIPEYAAAIDIYGDWVHVQEYQAPSSIEINKAKQRFDLLISVLPEVLGVDRNNIIVKTRRQQKGLSQYERQANAHHEFIVEENGFKFHVNLKDYLDTGLFLDHRDTRQLIFDKISKASQKGVFLNLFSYTSAFSVYAAAAGAQTVSVDMSNTYLRWSERNFNSNGLMDGDKHQFVKADCIPWLVIANRNNEKYKWIFIDPPTFSNSKSMEDVFDVQKDHVQLIELAMSLLVAGGEIIFSNNFKRFKLDKCLYDQYQVENIGASTLPEDFKRSPKVHHCFSIKM